MKPRVLVIDDDEAVLQSCETILEDAGYDGDFTSTPEDGLDRMRHKTFDVALVDLKLPGMSGLEVLEEAAKIDPLLDVIIFTGYGTIESAVGAVKKGAFNYITKPFTSAQLLSMLGTAVEHARRVRGIPSEMPLLQPCCALHQIVGQSEALRAVLATVAKVAASEANVLVTGPSGTGKELIARAIHANSVRRDRPFVPVDCAAMPAQLLESELFGYEKGAFTGATQPKRGLLETANGGTVFFDEIGEMTAELQAKLLRVLQERAFRRLGSERLVNVDVRIVACTNRDLDAEAQQGRFRQDLLYRLNVVTLSLPALRDRAGDIAILAHHFAQTFGQASNKGRIQISPDALCALEQHAWPGNVRELRNVVERAVVLCDGGRISLRDLPESLRANSTSDPSTDAPAYKVVRERWIDSRGRQYVADLLERHAGNVSAAAREAQISRKSFYELMRRFELHPRGGGPNPTAVSSR